MSEPAIVPADGVQVDLVIAVHTATRPIARAVASALRSTPGSVRVTVVAHNIDPEVIRGNLGEWADHPHVRLRELADGIPSPAGPMNAGLDAATAPFVAVMGSDDELAPGAIDSWLRLQRRSGAAMVLARIEKVGAGVVHEPPVRPFRRRGLDGAKDRLSYRSAPLGIVSRAAFGELRFAVGLPSGEDLAYVTRMWFSGRPIAFDRRGPAYLVHPDATDRVTSAPRAVAADFAFLDGILGAAWFTQLSRPHREAIGVKLLRTHLFDAVLNRAHIEWTADERSSLAGVASRIVAAAGAPERHLSRVDRRLLAAILAPEVPAAEMTELVHARRRYLTVEALLTARLRDVLHRQAPLRTLAAGFLVR